MKKLLTLLLTVSLCAGVLAGCGGDGTPKESSAPPPAAPSAPAAPSEEPADPATETPEVPGEIYDTGAFRALVPEGWAACPITDVFSEENAADPSCFNIIKGGESDLDLFYKPYVRLDYYGPHTQLVKPGSEYYENVQEIAPMQLGGHTWSGFIGEGGYGRSAILWAEEGDIQYQAIIWLENEGETISLEDADVQAILASAEPSDGSVSTAEPSAETVPVDSFDWWEDDWYGWWTIQNGTGVYQEAGELGLAWDAYAEIDVYNDNTGRVTIWDTGTSRDETLIIAYDVSFEPGAGERGRLVSRRVDFFPYGRWNGGMSADTMSEREIGWTIDPALSTVSHFEQMLEITGHYESPENPADSFDYSIYLRPWGVLWDDVRNGDTSGCIYSDMMPLYHDNWYIGLLQLGFERPTSSFLEGAEIVNEAAAGAGGSGSGSAGALDPAEREGADGKVDMATLKAGLAWCKENASYDTPYAEIAAQFGAHGKQIESLFENTAIYRWWATEDAYVQISFTLGADGSELWNVTQYDGLS